MSDDFFKPEDFENAENSAHAVRIANAKLAKHIAGLQDVWLDFGVLDNNLKTAHLAQTVAATHRGKLWGVEEIDKKACAHPYDAVHSFYDSKEGLTGHCNCCGKKLKARWEISE